jgi:hypothetical protein
MRPAIALFIILSGVCLSSVRRLQIHIFPFKNSHGIRKIFLSANLPSMVQRIIVGASEENLSFFFLPARRVRCDDDRLNIY